jgi:hypothetical protein
MAVIDFTEEEENLLEPELSRLRFGLRQVAAITRNVTTPRLPHCA